MCHFKGWFWLWAIWSRKLLEVLWAPRKWLEGSLDLVLGVYSHS